MLLDHDIEGHAKYLQAGLRETGWDRDLTIEFVRLHDLALSEDASDQDIWRFAQHHRLLLITSNRNQENETSLQATIDRENTPEALGVRRSHRPLRRACGMLQARPVRCSHGEHRARGSADTGGSPGAAPYTITVARWYTDAVARVGRPYSRADRQSARTSP